MDAINTTPTSYYWDYGQSTADPTGASPSMSQQGGIYSPTLSQPSSTSQFNQPPEQNGAHDHLNSPDSGDAAPVDDYGTYIAPPRVQPRFNELMGLTQSPNGFLTFDPVGANADEQVVPYVLQSEETPPSRTSAQQYSPIDNLPKAPQFQLRQAIPTFNNSTGNAPSMNINNFINVQGYQIANIISPFAPPTYPDTSHYPGMFIAPPVQGYSLQYQDNATANAAAAESADTPPTRPSKKGSGKATKAAKQQQSSNSSAPERRPVPAPATTVTNVATVTSNASPVTVKLDPNDASKTKITFVPPPAQRTTRKSAVATRANNPAQTYGDQTKDYPIAEAAPPRNIYIGMLEILIFFPNWLLLVEVALRAQMNGWTRKDVAKGQLYGAGLLGITDAAGILRASNRIQKQFSAAGAAMFNTGGAWSGLIPRQRGYEGHTDLTAKEWRSKAQWEGSEKEFQFNHISLKSVYDRVPDNNWPQGEDHLILTKCLRFAKANEHLDLDTSHFSWIMKVLGLAEGAHLDDDHDRAALARFRAQFP